MSELTGLRDDVYRRPLATALDRLGLGPGWRCVDVGAGGGDVSVALAEMVGRDGRVYAVDSDPAARDEVARAASAHAQVIALTQAGEDLTLPEQVDLAFCRFLLLHVHDPAVVLVHAMAASVVKPGPGWWRRSPSPRPKIRIDGTCRSPMPDARHPDIGALACPPWCARPASTSSTLGPKHPPASDPDRWPATWPRSPASTPATIPVVLPPLVTDHR